jgi:hypothetical protein
MKQKDEKTLRLLLKTGQNISLYANTDVIAELMSHPKFVPMSDDSNIVFVSIEDIAGFEILDNRKVIPLVQPEESPAEIKEVKADATE